jgi:hypothetical protein
MSRYYKNALMICNQDFENMHRVILAIAIHRKLERGMTLGTRTNLTVGIDLHNTVGKS